VDTGKVTSTSTSTTVTLPSTVGIYYWRVTTWDTYGVQGAWSAGRAIIVDRIKVNSLTADKTRLDPGETVTLSVQLVYEYDSAYITSGNLYIERFDINILSGSNGVQWTATDSKTTGSSSHLQQCSWNRRHVWAYIAVNMNGKSVTVTMG